MKQYIYKDNKKKGIIIFQCIASDILAADELYKQNIGADPVKQVHIGCSIKEPNNA